MAFVTNYGDLKVAVAGTMHRSDFTVDQFDRANQIISAEISDIYKGWDNVLSDVLTDADRWVAEQPEYFLPQEFYEILEVFSGDVDPGVHTVIGSNVYSQLQTSRRNSINVLRSEIRIPPEGYTISPDHSTIRFSPNPAVGSSIIIYFREIVTVFTSDADLNNLLTFRPNIYIYGMCKHLAIFVQDMEMAEAYDQLFSSAIQAANTQSEESTGDGPVVIEGAAQFC